MEVAHVEVVGVVDFGSVTLQGTEDGKKVRVVRPLAVENLQG